MKRGEIKSLAIDAGLTENAIRYRMKAGASMEQVVAKGRRKKLITVDKDAARFRWMLANGELGEWTREDVDKEMEIDLKQGQTS